MKNWPSRERWGPTTCPPLSTSQLVPTKSAMPASNPTTMARRTAFTRRTRVSIRCSQSASEFVMAAPWGRFSKDVLEKLSQRDQPRALLHEADVYHVRQIAHLGEDPAGEEARQPAVGQAEERPNGRHAEAREELTKER